MRIGLQTWGSHGDIRPFLALAEGLQGAGHEVTLAFTCVDSDRYAGLRSASGVRLRQVAAPRAPDRQALARIGDAIVRERNAVRQTQQVIEQLLLPAEAEIYEASERLCRENELLIGHYFLYPLAAAAEKLGRPCASVALAHGAVPSAFQPPAGMPDLGPFGNRLAWQLGRWVMNRGLKRYPDRLRARIGLPPAGDMIDTVWTSTDLTLLAISPVLCKPQPDWPGHYQLCGALDAPAPVGEGSVSPDLQSFLSDGPAPVYMGFGSMMSGGDQGQTLELLVAAAQAAGVRAVIQAPDWEALGFASTAQLHFVSAAPHAAVFPQCCAVLHHGGAGTSQAALRAGVPSIVVAFTAEQDMWGRELRRLGVAGPCLRRHQARPAQLAAAIRQVVQSARCAEQARALAQRMAEEDGVATAVRLIGERFST